MLQFCLSAILGAVLAAAVPWAPPRTSWGDPDLQGSYANNNEYATPLERPAEFDGKRASDRTPAVPTSGGCRTSISPGAAAPGRLWIRPTGRFRRSPPPALGVRPAVCAA